MKLRYLFSMIVASVLLFAGCAKEVATDSFANIKLDKTFISISENGGDAQLTINATESWVIDTTYTQDVWPNVITYKKNDKGESYVSKCVPSWLTIDKMEGAEGETVLTLSAEAVAGGRELELCIKAGANSQFFKVRQGSLEAQSATCAEVNAGPDGKTYRVKGIVKSIVNTTYGNWYLEDATGEVYVYGTLDKDGKTKNFESLGLEVGDEVEIEGPKLTYGTTVELVDVTVLSIKKALVKIVTEEPKLAPEAKEFDVKVAFKGDGLYPVVAEDAKSWISISAVKTYPGTPTKIEPNPADTALVSIAVAENPTYDLRKGVVTFSSASEKTSSQIDFKITQNGQPVPVLPTIAEVRASKDGDNVVTEGTVMAVHQKGFILSDATGTIYVYVNAAPEVKVGNKVKVSGEFANYYGTLQIKNPTVDENDNSTAAPAYPTPVDLTDQATYDAYAKYSAENPTDFAFVKIKGVLSDGRNITVGTSSKQSQLDWSNGDYSALNGKEVVVTAYMKGFHSKGYYQIIETSLVEATAGEPEKPAAPVVKTLTNAEICAAMTSSETSYVEYTINSASGVWKVNASQLTGNTFLQCRGRKGSYIKTPEFEKDIKSVTLHFSEAKKVYADNVYCVFPASWTASTEDAAYSEEGNVGKAVTVADSYTLTIPVEAGNKQVNISIIGTYSYYLDHIDVEL